MEAVADATAPPSDTSPQSNTSAPAHASAPSGATSLPAAAMLTGSPAASCGVMARAPGGPSLAELLDVREEQLAGVHSRVRLLDCPKNKTVITEGERTQSIYVIRSGKVKVFLNGNNGREISISVLGPGEYFGEMGLDEGPRSASVTTLAASQFFVVPVAVFRQLIARHPDFAMAVIRKLILRARSLLNNVGSLALLDVHGRVARLLFDLASEEDGVLVVNGPLTKQDIANRVGASREMVSRVFRDLVSGGYIEVRKGRIAVARTLLDRKLATCSR